MKKACIFLSIFSLFLSLYCFAVAATKNRPGLSLKETFDIYVRSVQNSDLIGLFSTVTDKEHFFFLTSTGKLINTRQGYYKFHEDWFKEKDWEMPVDLLGVHEGKEYGYTTAIFHYKSKLPDQYKLICFTPIGVPDKWPEMPPKKKLEDLVIFNSF